MDFLKAVDQWHTLAQDYVSYYLAGDPGAIVSKGLRFPSRHHSVINHRDRILYERMLEYLTRGGAVAFVGESHVRGVSKLLRKSGYQFKGPCIPEVGDRRILENEDI